MREFATLFTQLKRMFPDMPEKDIEEYALFMHKKYATVLEGDDVVHFDYYEGLLDNSIIEEIEINFSKVGLRLSRFDKNGVPYASIKDFTLEIAFFLQQPIVASLLIGVGGSALWDTIKNSVFLVCKQLRGKTSKSNKQLNFGIHISMNDNIKLDFKLDGDLDEEIILKSLDRIIPLLEKLKSQHHIDNNFYITNIKGEWNQVNIYEMIQEEILKNKKKDI